LGDDTLVGGDGDDMIFGGEGNDLVFGGADADTIFGGMGDDQLYAQGGRDFVEGQDGDDNILGGGGNDELRGGNGDDFIRGDAGNDLLRGQNGEDRLFGSDGRDSLIGGAGFFDFLSGGEGADRFLALVDDFVEQREVQDALIQFRNGSNNWTNIEMEVLDRAFARLEAATENTRLLKDTETVEPLVFIKETTIPAGPHIANPELVEIVEQVRNPATGELVEQVTIERRYSVGDWDEFDADTNRFHELELPQVIGLAWASTEQIQNVLSQEDTLWNQFLRLSDWIPAVDEFGNRVGNPNTNFYQISTDNQWFHLQNALFAEDFARTNPQEDFGTVWRLFFEEGRETEKVRLRDKIAFADNLFQQVGSLF